MIEPMFDDGFTVAWEVTCDAIVSPVAARAAGFDRLTTNQLADLVKFDATQQLSASDLAAILQVLQGRSPAIPDLTTAIELAQSRLNNRK